MFPFLNTHLLQQHSLLLCAKCGSMFHLCGNKNGGPCTDLVTTGKTEKLQEFNKSGRKTARGKINSLLNVSTT